MGVELRPLGVKCNIRCQYCYQNPERDASNILHSYDLALMKAAIEEEGEPFTLFGGEPLLLPTGDLETIWSWGMEKFGRNSIQTNGTLISDLHIELFKRYKVNVGISVDGPDDLNDARWAGGLGQTRTATQRTHSAIERLCREGIPPSLIITLHRGNATRVKLPIMNDWVRRLDGLGVMSARLHILEVENEAIQRELALSDEENLEALRNFKELEKDLALRFDLFVEMRRLLLGKDEEATCVWNACDPYTTRAVRGVEGNGQRSNCGRTNKDGIDFVKSDLEGYERYLALYCTPQEYGGCQGCRFFLMCKGQCPGTAIDRDWRNRTEHCAVWKAMYGDIEAELVAQGEAPLSLSPERVQVEQIFIESWAAGRNMMIATALASLRNNERGCEGRAGNR